MMQENQMITNQSAAHSHRGRTFFSRAYLPLMGNCFRHRHHKADRTLPSSHRISGSTQVSSRSSTHSYTHPSPVKGYSDKAKPQTLPTPKLEGFILSCLHLKAFTLNDLKDITRNFSPDNLLGEGGFGKVYKGWIDEQSFGPAMPGPGMAVAVKKLKSDGYQWHKEWLASKSCQTFWILPRWGESASGIRVHAPRQLGGSSVSQYAEPFSRGVQPLPWATRIEVAIGAARGLAFLQEFNSKLSDFGFAKAGPTVDRTHVSTEALGTLGHAAPEYILTGWLTARCDVYSSGVVLLELLSGRRAINATKSGVEQNLVDWERTYLGDRRKLLRIMGSKLEGQYPQRAAYTAAILALKCIREAKIRPQMSKVLATLERLQLARTSRADKSPSLSPVVDRGHTTETSSLRHSTHYSITEKRHISNHLSESTTRSPLASPVISSKVHVDITA